MRMSDSTHTGSPSTSSSARNRQDETVLTTISSTRGSPRNGRMVSTPSTLPSSATQNRTRVHPGRLSRRAQVVRSSADQGGVGVSSARRHTSAARELFRDPSEPIGGCQSCIGEVIVGLGPRGSSPSRLMRAQTSVVGSSSWPVGIVVAVDCGVLSSVGGLAGPGVSGTARLGARVDSWLAGGGLTVSGAAVVHPTMQMPSTTRARMLDMVARICRPHMASADELLTFA